MEKAAQEENVKLINPNKTKTIRELGEVDMSKLLEVVNNLSQEIWDMDNQSKPNKFKALNNTQHIVMKFVRNFNDFTNYYERPLWPILKKHIEPLLKEAVKPYGYEKGEFPRVMLAKLPAGSDITKHRDGTNAAVFPHKIHIPLTTNDQCFFFVDDVKYHFEPGFAYEVNNNTYHAVTNGGESDRIHLIFEYFDASIKTKIGK